jgi:hypothetical protein
MASMRALGWAVRQYQLWVFRTNVTADFGIVTGNFGPS